MSEKIGLGVLTYNRPEYFKKIFSSIPLNVVDEIVIVNDGTPYKEKVQVPYIQHDKNKGIGVSKNNALKHLLNKGCDYIFLMEDDIIIKDPEVFQAYIKASKETGIQHFNYSQHGLMNKLPNTDTPNPKTKIEYKNNIIIDLYLHCVGAFSFYTKKCLDKVGLMDETFYNATEHLEHTYNIIKATMHPSFWWFADIHDSNKYLTDIPWSPQTSTISSKPNHANMVRKGLDYFKTKHKIGLFDITQNSLDVVKSELKHIYLNK
jgi:glycosyltransferase involved in cell wall biosynthesis